MSVRQRTIESAAIGAIVALILILGSTGCRTANGHSVQAAGDSFFPLAKGNRWVFATIEGGRVAKHDTVVVDQVSHVDGWRYYHLRASWPGFGENIWLRRDNRGNVYWTSDPHRRGEVFLQFDARIGQRWQIADALHECLDTLVMFDNYAAVRTPYGLFDGARSFGSLPSCSDFGWGVATARGIGPVQWSAVTIAGLQEWVLVAADIRDEQIPVDATSRIVNGH